MNKVEYLSNKILIPSNSQPFKIISDFKESGDQPEAISSLVKNIKKGEREQVLLGVTGSGKTFTMAKVIEELQRPSLIMAPNKTLAAQLYGEMKSLFPNNKVEYFVSYYDYYTPEAYVPRSDTYIEKESSINEQIDRLRHSATRSLVERRDTIIVASVSCIYGIGSVDAYSSMSFTISKNQKISREHIIRKLVDLLYKRRDMDFKRGSFRAKGDILEIFPSHYEDRSWKISMFGDEIESIVEIDPLTAEKINILDNIRIFANSHYVTPKPTIKKALGQIKEDLKKQLKVFEFEKKLLEKQRLDERTNFDLEMIETTGSCSGIENYSRYLSGRKPGEPPPTLYEYIPEDALLFVDESHLTCSQIAGMYKGDFSRKSTLSKYGFRLPSCLDNRPLKREEWDAMRPQTIFVSATPSEYELSKTEGIFVEQVIRPTGLVDPPIQIHPTEHQIDHLIDECRSVIENKHRVMITTLTKKMAEDLTEYMHEEGFKVRYLHSDIDTLERIAIIRDLRLGVFNILIGINLLREGLDIPECALVAILDADKEGYLRSKTSLIQTIGRAARNVDSRVIMYADNNTKSMQEAIEETRRRREKQLKYNKDNKITPLSIKKNIDQILDNIAEQDHVTIEVENVKELVGKDLDNYINKLDKEMKDLAAKLEFEEAAKIRDEINRLKAKQVGLPKKILGLKN
ncbi:MAG: UvrABC system protein B [Alphaproteobacteria bacterium MarineAlpha5_Bin6]|nr:MAG: UvrABC system protein B [Alphaproteobacteria bacterium MarineAlpha5_Bin7]PPR54302.1 MAG: UvrABC system protein B [Alphaproteobacteria bacterium MarineAlpha5_Bin6]|tara:strand:- start:863 stop:2920 length:2058 start_codon:yes stop_codon:yes gene_type:complete